MAPSPADDPPTPVPPSEPSSLRDEARADITLLRRAMESIAQTIRRANVESTRFRQTIDGKVSELEEKLDNQGEAITGLDKRVAGMEPKVEAIYSILLWFRGLRGVAVVVGVVMTAIAALVTVLKDLCILP